MTDTMKRTIKDSVFKLLLSKPEYVMALYCMLHPEDETVKPEDFQAITLENTLVSGIYNDFSVQVRDLLIIMMEAQNRVSLDAVLRILLCFAETYDRYVKSYDLNLLSITPKIPRPELYIVYTGLDKTPFVVSPAKLFMNNMEDTDGNLKCRQEIQGKYGFQVRVIRGSGNGDILDQYIRFCEISNETHKKCGSTMKAVRDTISQCMEEGVLKEFLSKKRLEVENAMEYMYTQNETMRFHDLKIRQEESEKGIRALVEALQSVSQSRDAVIKMVMDKFGLQSQTAADKVTQYWA